MVNAVLIYHFKEESKDRFIKELIIWELPESTLERPHGWKYRLYFGRANGTSLVRYDNEVGKGDHKHMRDKEEAYNFNTIEQLIMDFEEDVQRIRDEEKTDKNWRW